MSQEQQVFGWESVIGQNQLTDNLQNALKFNKISHAYMIQGEKLSGKRMIADIFARALQCESEGERPCNQCRSCKQAMNGNHPDIIYVEHDKPNVISVDNIRTQINGDIAIKPYSGPHKIYIMDEATSNIDVESENKIMEVLYELSKEKLVLCISHRLANLVNADHIYCLKDGNIVESGSHKELLQQNGVYCELFNTQEELERYGA